MSIERYISIIGMRCTAGRWVKVKYYIGWVNKMLVFNTKCFANSNSVIYFMDFLNYKVLVETDIA